MRDYIFKGLRRREQSRNTLYEGLFHVERPTCIIDECVTESDLLGLDLPKEWLAACAQFSYDDVVLSSCHVNRSDWLKSTFLVECVL